MAYLSVSEIAKNINVSEKTIYDWVAKRRFPAPVRFGRLLRWNEDVIQKAVDSGTIGRSQPKMN